MKIAVIGAGAMGSLFGGKLTSVTDVWLVDPWAEHVAAMRQNGLELTNPDGTIERISVQAVGTPEEVVVLPEGSWGEGGFHWVWFNEWTRWT
ncbi:MAG TPA: hypothetical protein EYP04_02815, partial [Anaerolineae bacterium]|nr:hypothetical protein [Anaerolineae bacterium]